MKSTKGHSVPYLLTIGFHIEEIIQVHMNNRMHPQASLLQQSQFFIIQETMMYPTLVPQENSAGLNLLASLLVGEPNMPSGPRNPP